MAELDHLIVILGYACMLVGDKNASVCSARGRKLRSIANGFNRND